MVAAGLISGQNYPPLAEYGCRWFNKWTGLSSKGKVMVAAALISRQDYKKTNLYFLQSTILKS
jgi:hypothetical protein